MEIMSSISTIFLIISSFFIFAGYNLFTHIRFYYTTYWRKNIVFLKNIQRYNENTLNILTKIVGFIQEFQKNVLRIPVSLLYILIQNHITVRERRTSVFTKNTFFGAENLDFISIDFIIKKDYNSIVAPAEAFLRQN